MQYIQIDTIIFSTERCNDEAR